MSNLATILNRILDRKIAFLVAFFVTFTFSYGLLFALDWLPEAPAAESTESPGEFIESETPADFGVALPQSPEPALLERDILPNTIVIDALGKEVSVLNPTSRSIADLDEALLSGVVRHPDSATLADDGNVFILGHSSYLPNVLNRNFQAFNGIQKLVWGDTIELVSSDTVYTYRVEKVYQARASALTVPVAGTGRMLTLATCNSFGSTDDRYIVEASFISERPR